ncbi:MAG: hypothetical protein ACHQHN_17020 [Sphingobacteriales bacterium]
MLLIRPFNFTKTIAWLRKAMMFILKQFRQIILTAAYLLVAVTAISQVKPGASTVKSPIAKKAHSKQLTDFRQLNAEANVVFTFPAGFKEIKALNNADFSYDYAVELPDHDFEIWFVVRSQKRDWQQYELVKNDPTKQTANPDSNYVAIGRAQASAFTGETNSQVRIIPPDILARYNASAGRTYLLNLLDRVETRHFKYALLITLEKDHTGTILAVCLTNDKGPEFFKNINKAVNCLKFKP